MLPREIFPDFNSLLSHSDRILASCFLLARMKPCKSADYFIKVSFRIVVDMNQGESKPFSTLTFYIIENINYEKYDRFPYI